MVIAVFSRMLATGNAVSACYSIKDDKMNAKIGGIVTALPVNFYTRAVIFGS